MFFLLDMPMTKLKTKHQMWVEVFVNVLKREEDSLTSSIFNMKWQWKLLLAFDVKSIKFLVTSLSNEKNTNYKSKPIIVYFLYIPNQENVEWKSDVSLFDI